MSTTMERIPLADAYVLMAWEILRDESPKGGRHPCVHSTWTPFNKLFRELFPGIDPVEYTRMLKEEGLIDIALMRGGALIKPNESFLTRAPKGHRETLSQMRRLLKDAAKQRRKQLAEAAARKKAKEEVSSTSKPNGKMSTKVEQEARKAWEAGDTAAALKRLGY